MGIKILPYARQSDPYRLSDTHDGAMIILTVEYISQLYTTETPHGCTTGRNGHWKDIKAINNTQIKILVTLPENILEGSSIGHSTVEINPGDSYVWDILNQYYGNGISIYVTPLTGIQIVEPLVYATS